MLRPGNRSEGRTREDRVEGDDVPGEGAPPPGDGPFRGTYGVVLPVCNEEESLGFVLEELTEATSGCGATLIPAVGLNGTTDRSEEIARAGGALTGKSRERGYGHGCRAAIERLVSDGVVVDAYIFVSGDGADPPEDVMALIAAYESGGADMVIGNRTLRLSNWQFHRGRRAFPNVTLASVASILTGRLFLDIGPLRLIDRELFERLKLRELTWGWTIEAQILAARHGARIRNLHVGERPRFAGEQKVSGVNWRRSLGIGFAILAAAWRARWREL